MNLLDRLTEKAFRAFGATEMQRDYAAARPGRLVGDVHALNLSANVEIRGSIRQLRAHSRLLARDNDYFIGFLKKAEANVIGTDGLKLQVDAKNASGEKKEVLNRKVEAEWCHWSRKQNCDVTGQQSMRDIAALALKTLITDGEFLIRFVFDPSSQYGLKLQMLDVDWLDEDYNAEPLQSPNGNRIVMSVEVDAYEKPVAYWLTDPRWSRSSVPNLRLVPQAVRRLRIPADQIIHRFPKERIGQLRGVPQAHGAMLTMNQLDGFDEAELIGARINASNMAFVSPPAPLDASIATDKAGIDTEVAPGQVLELPAGYTVHEFSPNKPLDSDFASRMLRKIATSFGVDYATFTGDLSEVNFSSIRAGTIEVREVWRIVQKWLADHLYQDVYEKWLMFNTTMTPATILDQVMYPIWRGRGFEWVDPSKDINADIAAVNRGLKTMTEVLAERGEDFEEIVDQLAYEKQYIERKGLQLSSPDVQAQLAATADAQSSQDEPTGKQQKQLKAKAGK